MMKPTIRIPVIAFCVILLASCGQSTAGPNTWLDRPLHGMHFAIGPIILQAHASDADGISGILFYVSGDLVADVDLSGGQLEEAMYQWTPSQAGVFTISAVGVDSQSNRGSTASAVISVGDLAVSQGTAEPARTTEIEQVDTPTPSPTPTRTPTPTKTPTPSSTPDLAGPTILMERLHAYGDPAFTLDYMVGGSPSGCGNRRLGVHQLLLNDPGGIWSVWADWTAGSQSGTVYYTTSNGYLFSGVYGPFSDNGFYLSINGRANDNFGNWTPIIHSNWKWVTHCIE